MLSGCLRNMDCHTHWQSKIKLHTKTIRCQALLPQLPYPGMDLTGFERKLEEHEAWLDEPTRGLSQAASTAQAAGQTAQAAGTAAQQAQAQAAAAQAQQAPPQRPRLKLVDLGPALTLGEATTPLPEAQALRDRTRSHASHRPSGSARLTVVRPAGPASGSSTTRSGFSEALDATARPAGRSGSRASGTTSQGSPVRWTGCLTGPKLAPSRSTTRSSLQELSQPQTLLAAAKSRDSFGRS